MSKRLASPDTKVVVAIARIESRERTTRMLVGGAVLVLGLLGMVLRPDVAWQISAALGIIEGAIVAGDVSARRGHHS